VKPLPKFDNEDSGRKVKMSDEIKSMLDPINLGLLKPIATITESPDEL